MMTVESDDDIVSDELPSPDLDPSTYNNEEDKVYNELNTRKPPRDA